MRTLNVFRAALLMVGCLLFAGAVHAMHYYQVKRNASVFLDAADKAEAKKDYPAAMRNLRWYLDLVQGSPEEAKTLERLGFMITDTAPNPKAAARAIPIFEQLLRHGSQSVGSKAAAGEDHAGQRPLLGRQIAPGAVAERFARRRVAVRTHGVVRDKAGQRQQGSQGLRASRQAGAGPVGGVRSLGVYPAEPPRSARTTPTRG